MVAAIGFVMFAYMFYLEWFIAAPRFYAEWTHADAFVPAHDARIVKAKCTNFDLVLANNCEVTLVTADGRTQTLTDWRFGRAPSGTVRLLERATTPPSYSTDVSLRTLHQRLAMFVAMAVLSAFFVVGSLILLVRFVSGRNAIAKGRSGSTTR